MDRHPAHERNRRSWNAVTPAHNRHKGDQAAAFAAGLSTLYPEDLDLLEDVAGRDVLHLQCNCGQDTLSLARLGARVTGVDISDAAIDVARGLSEGSGIPATFHRADVLAFLEDPPAAWDVVYTSYGALIWLSDLGAWARGVARALRPGGAVVVMEYHPVASMYAQDLSRRWPYSSEGAPILEEDGVSDYVGEQSATWARDPAQAPFVNPEPAVSFSWGVADLLGAMLDARLRIEVVREYSFSNGYRPFDACVPGAGRRWYLDPALPALPLMLGVRARRG